MDCSDLFGPNLFRPAPLTCLGQYRFRPAGERGAQGRGFTWWADCLQRLLDSLSSVVSERGLEELDILESMQPYTTMDYLRWGIHDGDDLICSVMWCSDLHVFQVLLDVARPICFNINATARAAREKSRSTRRFPALTNEQRRVGWTTIVRGTQHKSEKENSGTCMVCQTLESLLGLWIFVGDAPSRLHRAFSAWSTYHYLGLLPRRTSCHGLVNLDGWS